MVTILQKKVRLLLRPASTHVLYKLKTSAGCLGDSSIIAISTLKSNETLKDALDW
jgi:hypothetical protein